VTNITPFHVIEEEIIDTFSFLDDWSTRYEHIIDLGKNLGEFPDSYKIPSNKIEGCQSQVWVHSEFDGDIIRFQATSDSTIVKGLIALLLSAYSKRTPEDILKNPPNFLEKIELSSHLSPTRSNGLAALVSHIQTTASNALLSEK
tara:strand:- start:9 stop:443 length:435 start_codon:yes stop_codon:yes gene_type:complete